MEGVTDEDAVDGLSAQDRSRLRRAWWAGAAPMLALYTWVLTAGRADLLQRRFFDDFYDAQGRAIADGRLDVPPEVVSFEGFLVDGRTYTYFGPFPSLIRLPVLAVTDRFDGRLTSLSMLAAMVVLAVAAFRLAGAVRAMVRGGAPVTRLELWGYALVAVASLAGPPFFLASATIVYHEAALWGVALSVAGFDAVARWQLAPDRRRLAVAGALICGALLSRQSTALGPLIALGLAGAIPLLRGWAASRATGTPATHRLRSLLPGALRLGAVLVLITLPSVAVHYAKFGLLVGVPFDKQVYSQLSSEVNQGRDEVVATNPSFQGTEYLSTTALQYFRPDALDLRGELPWIDFPRGGPTVVDDSAVFDTLDWSSSIPDTTPALTALSLVAVVWAGRRARRRDGERDDERPAGGRVERLVDRLPPAPLLPLVAGAAASGLAVLSFAYVANRYLNDIYPLVLVGGLVGANVLLGWLPGRSPAVRRAAVTALAALVAASVLVNLALALVYQRERGHAVPRAWLVEWVSWRLDLPGDPPVMTVASGTGTGEAGTGDDRPPVVDGALLVVGDCDRLYTGVRDRWLRVDAGTGRDPCDRVAPG